MVNIENYMPGNAAYWEVAILDDHGFLWQYHHIEPSSIPKEIHKAFKDGNSIPVGTKIGEVYSWDITTFGERYHHIHLNVLGKDKEYLSPFLFLKSLGDKQAPVIIKIEKVGRDFHVEVADLILHQRFLVPPHEVSYEVDGGERVIVWKFDKLPGGNFSTKYVHDFFVKEKTCGDYQCRKFVVSLAFAKKSFPTSPGSHRLLVQVTDFEGNRSEKALEWREQ